MDTEELMRRIQNKWGRCNQQQRRLGNQGGFRVIRLLFLIVHNLFICGPFNDAVKTIDIQRLMTMIVNKGSEYVRRRAVKSYFILEYASKY
jgi:hypothetical protein